METIKYKYSCKLCNFDTLYLSEWIKHEQCEKHKRGGKKKSTQCELCGYTSNTHWNIKMHILTQHSTKEERENQKYYCKYCDKVFFCSQYMNSHMNSKKHKDIIYAIENYK